MDGVAGVRPPRSLDAGSLYLPMGFPHVRDGLTQPLLNRTGPPRSRPAGARNAAQCSVKIIQASFFSSSSGAAAERNCLFIAGNDNEEGKREANASSHPPSAAGPTDRPRYDTLNFESTERENYCRSASLFLSSLPRSAVSRSLTDRRAAEVTADRGTSLARPSVRPSVRLSIDWHGGEC